jgi:hypothetical protein
MKDQRSFAPLSFPAVATIATAMGAVAVGAFAIGALAVGRLAIRRLEVEKAYLKSVEIEDLTVTRLHAAEVTVSDSLKLPRSNWSYCHKVKKNQDHPARARRARILNIGRTTCNL